MDYNKNLFNRKILREKIQYGDNELMTNDQALKEFNQQTMTYVWN